MDPEIEKILLDNLRETLRQFQNYIVWGVVATLSYYLLVTNKSNTTSINLPVIGSFESLDKDLASIICISVFWFLGCMASYALQRADRISLTLKAHGKNAILKAVLTFPSIATEFYPLIRLAPVIISILLIIGARLEIWNSNIKAEIQIFKIIILLTPYITIGIQLLKNSLAIDKLPKIKINR